MANSKKLKGMGREDQSRQVYNQLSRRYMPMEGGEEACVNSRSLNSFVPKNHMPEDVVDVRYTKKGVKVTKVPGDAEKAFVQNGRRHQMRLSAHMDSGARATKDQTGKYPQGNGICYSRY